MKKFKGVLKINFIPNHFFLLNNPFLILILLKINKEDKLKNKKEKIILTGQESSKLKIL